MTEFSFDKVDLISMDLGQSGGIAFWQDKKCIAVYGWALEKNPYKSKFLWDIVQWIKDVVEQYKPIVVVERPSMRLPHQWILYSDIREIAGENKCEFAAFMPMSIKKEVTGSGKATKEEVQKAVLESGLVDSKVVLEGEHMHDAVAVGACYLKKNG